MFYQTHADETAFSQMIDCFCPRAHVDMRGRERWSSDIDKTDRFPWLCELCVLLTQFACCIDPWLPAG